MNTPERFFRGARPLSLLLLCALLMSALLVIFNSHNSRRMFHELQTLQQEAVQREVEWSQLLLEESAFSTHTLVERKARQELKMLAPNSEHIVAVKN
ncbi:MAG: cell division protein FtsL [Pseudomonadales bacterium]